MYRFLLALFLVFVLSVSTTVHAQTFGSCAVNVSNALTSLSLGLSDMQSNFPQKTTTSSMCRFASTGVYNVNSLNSTAGLVATFSATDLLPLVSAGESVSLWPDQSGNGNHFVRNLAGATSPAPTFAVQSTPNLLPSVYFNKAYMNIPNMNLTYEPFTICMSFKLRSMDTSTGFDIFFSQPTSDTTCGTYCGSFSVGLNVNSQPRRFAVQSNRVHDVTSSLPIMDTNWHVLCVWSSGHNQNSYTGPQQTATIAPIHVGMSVDGKVSSVPLSPNGVRTPILNSVTLGFFMTTFTSFQADVHRFVMYRRVLFPTERHAVTSYMMKEIGLPLMYVPTRGQLDAISQYSIYQTVNNGVPILRAIPDVDRDTRVESPDIAVDTTDGMIYFYYTAWNTTADPDIGYIGLATGTSLINLAKIPSQIDLHPTGALFGKNPTAGQTDSGYASGPAVYRDSPSSPVYLFYFGSPNTGFEATPATLHYATASTYSGPFTRQGQLIFTNAAGAWESTIQYRAKIVKDAGVFYLFYNSYGGGLPEAIGYATSTSLDGPWTRYSGNPVVQVEQVANGGDISRIGDPDILPYNGGWLMTIFGQRDPGMGTQIGLWSPTLYGASWKKFPITFIGKQTVGIRGRYFNNSADWMIVDDGRANVFLSQRVIPPVIAAC